MTSFIATLSAAFAVVLIARLRARGAKALSEHAAAPLSDRRAQFYARVFLALALFALFLTGLMLLGPWLLSSTNAGWPVAVGFVVILAVGYVYILRSNVLGWD